MLGEGVTITEMSCSPWEQPPCPRGCAAAICRLPSIPVRAAEGVCPPSAVPMETGDRWKRDVLEDGQAQEWVHGNLMTKGRVLHQGWLWVRATSDRGTSDPQNILTMLVFIQRSRHNSYIHPPHCWCSFVFGKGLSHV